MMMPWPRLNAAFTPVQLHVRSCFVLFAAMVLSSLAHAAPLEDTTARRPITVADAVLMQKAQFSGDLAAGPVSSVANFSPNGERFVIVLKKADVERNTNDFSLLLYRTATVLRSPKPDFILRMSSSSGRDAISKIRWLADSGSILFLGERPNETPQVYKLNINTKVVRRLTNHATAIVNYDASPDGSIIAFTAKPAERPRTTGAGDGSTEFVVTAAYLVDIVEGKYLPRTGAEVCWQASQHAPRCASGGPKYFIFGDRLTLSPGGRYIVLPAQLLRNPIVWAEYQDDSVQKIFSENYPDDVPSPLAQYLLLDTVDGSIAPLIDAPTFGESQIAWEKSARSVFLTSYLPLDVSDPAERQTRASTKFLVEVNLPSRAYRKSTKAELPTQKERVAPIEVTLDEDSNTPPRIFVSNSKDQPRLLLIDLNPQFKELSFGKVETIKWKVDGIELIGGLYLPPDFKPGTRYPLVIQTHGFAPREFSMDGRSEWSSAMAARPLAAQGIMVLQALNSENRQEFDQLVGATKLGSNSEESGKVFQMHAYQGAIDYLDGQGLIDRARVGIIGFSRTACYVGYALTHSAFRFAAASLVDGISCGYFEDLAYPWEGFDIDFLNGGVAPFGKGLEVWMKNSPGFNLDKVTAPVRVQSFENEAVLEAWEWYVGLRLQKKAVELAVFPGAAHLGVRPAQRTLTQQDVVDWFRFWLKGEEDPSPAKIAQYLRWRELRKENSAAPAAVN
jgi:dipeptidyl aminopeptidase/acylaminoacyl peptidase